MLNDESRLGRTLSALLLASLRGLGQKEQITILDRAGFGPTEIAGLLGSTSKAISVRLAEIRRAGRSGARGTKRA
jgi:DNA-directed RNA polymerase specialized sigma24 family protein